MASQDWMTKDFYKVLGVDKSADQQAIKKAYRKLARTYHPDQNRGDAAAEERFKEVGEAYAVLSDPGKRRQYDAIRTMAGGGARFSGGPQGGAYGNFADAFGSMFGGATGPAGGGFANARSRFGHGSGGFDDLLGSFFGGAGGNPFQQQPKGQDLTSVATLTLPQAVEGATLKLTVEGREMTVRIPPGMTNGQKLRLKGKGRPAAGGTPGDLILTIEIAPHPVFTLREGADVLVDVPLSVGEAVNGATVEVPLVDGQRAKMKVPPGTSSGTVLRLRGRGIKARGQRRPGDLLARVKIVVPSKPDRALRRSAIDFDARAGMDPRSEWLRQAGERA